MLKADSNPWGREYSDREWWAAHVAYPQYRKRSEKGRGPLIYANGEQLKLEVEIALERAENNARLLRTLKKAVDRETKKTEVVDD